MYIHDDFIKEVTEKAVKEAIKMMICKRFFDSFERLLDVCVA